MTPEPWHRYAASLAIVPLTNRKNRVLRARDLNLRELGRYGLQRSGVPSGALVRQPPLIK